MRLALALLAAASTAGCVAALAPQDVARLRDAQRASLRDYRDETISPVGRQYARVGYCLVGRVLEDEGATTVDAGGAIACEAKP